MITHHHVSPILDPITVQKTRKTINIIVVHAPIVEDPSFEVDISRPMSVFFPIT